MTRYSKKGKAKMPNWRYTFPIQLNLFSLYTFLQALTVAALLAGLIPLPAVSSLAPTPLQPLADLLPQPAVAQAQGAPNLLIDKRVSKAAPDAGETFTYIIRYRCASLTDHCFDAQIVDTVSGDLELVSYSATGGNVASVSENNGTITWELESDNVAGRLDAGSAGQLAIRVRFPACGVQSPAAGSIISNVATFSEATAGSVSSTANGADITVPTIDTCPAAPPTSTLQGFDKTSTPSVAMPGSIGGYFDIDLPENPITSTASYILTDTFPAEMIIEELDLSNILASPGVSAELLCGGVWYADGMPVDGELDLTSDLQNAAATNCTTEVQFGETNDDALFTNLEAFRVVVPPGTPAETVRIYYKVDETANIGSTLANTAQLLEPPTIDLDGDGTPGGLLGAGDDLQIVDLYPRITGSSKSHLTRPGYVDPGGNSILVNGELPASVRRRSETYSNVDLTTVYLDEMDSIHILTMGIDGSMPEGMNLVDPVFYDDLPAEYEFVQDAQIGNFVQMVFPPENDALPDQYNPRLNPACNTPEVTVIDDFNGDRDRLIIAFPGCIIYGGLSDHHKAPGIDEVFLSVAVSTRLKPGTPAGDTVVNDAYMTTATEEPIYCGSNVSTTDTTCTRASFYTVPTLATIDSNKYVQGALDSAFHRFPSSGFTDLDGNGVYQLTIDNTGNVEYTSIDIVDVLPFVGDTSLLDTADARGSAWSVELANDLVIERYDPTTDTWSVVPPSDMPLGPYYSSSTNPCRLEATGFELYVDEALAVEPAGCDANPWTGALATTAVGARSFGFRFAPATPLVPGERLRITVNAQQLTGEADAASGAIAWNSFAYGATYDDGAGTLQTLLATEPIKTGLEMIETNTTAALGNYVWFDSNSNGSQETGEPPIVGVTVNLYEADGVTPVLDSAGNPKTTTTDANGHHMFWGLDPNTTYMVRLDNPANHTTTGGLGDLTVTSPDASGDDTTDSDATLDATDGYPEITATTGPAGSENTTYDFGFIAPATVGNLVWDDLNGDGIQDVGEPGFAGITVNLLDSNGTIVDTQVTDVNGTYLFTNVVPGLYSLQFDPASLPITRTFTIATTASDPADDSDANSSGNTPQFVLEAGEIDVTWDAGLAPPVTDPAAISGRVWDDVDDDGLDNDGEPGVPGVMVQLLDGSGLLIQSTTTDANGNYLFGNLPPNVPYQVVFIPTSNHTISTNQDVPGDDTIDSDANPTTGETPIVTPGPNETITTIDAALISKLSLGNLVWFDINNNGLLDVGEAGISGVTVRLFDSTNTNVMTTTTDSAGKYVFSGLDAGDYSVQVDVPAGYVSSTDIGSTGTPNQLDGDDNGIDPTGATVSSGTITLVATGSTPGEASIGESDHGGIINGAIDTTADAKAYYTVDFGFYRPVNVGNRIWLDDNGDTVVDVTDDNGLYEPSAGETPLANVTVQAWLDNGDGSFDAATDGATPGTADGSATTDANGEYYITGLTPGSYWIVIPASNFDSSQPLAGLGSSTGAGDPNDASLVNDQRDDGGDTLVNGAVVSNGTVILTSASEPAGEVAATNDPGLIDTDSNWLADFGFAPLPEGTITIVKNTDGLDDTFTFTSTDVDLDALSINTFGATGSSATITKTEGAYTITEVGLAGWALDGITFSGDTDNGSSSSGAEATIDLDGGENITVTFTNSKVLEPQLAIDKVLVSPANGVAVVGDPIIFSLTISNTGKATMAELDLTDTFDPNFLIYNTASILPDTVSGGTLHWVGSNDGVNPASGSLQGMLPLAPGESFVITVEFVATRP